MAVLLDSNAPHISRNDFDKEAIEFLERYYPEALQSPMAVPILEIARKRMGLRVVERRLSEDFSVLGQMCFTSGIEEIYVKETDEYQSVKVRAYTGVAEPRFRRVVSHPSGKSEPALRAMSQGRCECVSLKLS